MTSRVIRFWAAAPLTLLSACAFLFGPVDSSLAPDFAARKPSRVAVLPVANETLYSEGPTMLREYIVRMFESRGYEVVPTSEVDDLLEKKLGIVYGAQTDGTEPAAIREAIGVDGLVITRLFEWNRTRVIERDQVTVGAEIELRVSAAPAPLWRARHEVFKQAETRSAFEPPERREDNQVFLPLVKELIRDIGETIPEYSKAPTSP